MHWLTGLVGFIFGGAFGWGLCSWMLAGKWADQESECQLQECERRVG